jgi:hypothetical protein
MASFPILRTVFVIFFVRYHKIKCPGFLFAFQPLLHHSNQHSTLQKPPIHAIDHNAVYSITWERTLSWSVNTWNAAIYHTMYRRPGPPLLPHIGKIKLLPHLSKKNPICWSYPFMLFLSFWTRGMDGMSMCYLPSWLHGIRHSTATKVTGKVQSQLSSPALSLSLSLSLSLFLSFFFEPYFSF